MLNPTKTQNGAHNTIDHPPLDHEDLPKHLNPWLSILIKPRVTIRYILAHSNYKKYTLPLFLLWGVGQFMIASFANLLPFFLPLQWLIPGIIIVGAFSALFFLYIGSFFLQIIAKAFKGKGTFLQTRTLLAWGNGVITIPPLALFFIASLSALIVSQLSDPTVAGSSLTLLAFLFFMLGVGACSIFGIWQIVIVVKMISEIHKISTGIAFLAGLLAFIITFFNFLTISSFTVLPLIYMVLPSIFAQ